jgi:hypothetical protein
MTFYLNKKMNLDDTENMRNGRYRADAPTGCDASGHAWVYFLPQVAALCGWEN